MSLVARAQLVSVFIFTWAYVIFVPSWVNEKHPSVSINKTIWYSGQLRDCARAHACARASRASHGLRDYACACAACSSRASLCPLLTCSF